MINLVVASLFLPLSHFLISSTPLRATLVNLFGERRYSLGYSLLAVAAVVWLVFAYRHAPVLPLWDAPQWLDLALIPVIIVSSILAVAGVTTPNPVIVRSEALFDRPDIVRGILRITRNAFFWGAGIFSITHIIILGDVAGLLMNARLTLLACCHSSEKKPFCCVAGTPIGGGAIVPTPGIVPSGPGIAESRES